MNLQLEGKAGLITGAGKGLGRAYALALASRGASVLVNNRVREGAPDSAAAVAEEIRNAGGKAEISHVDAMEKGAAAKMVEQAREAFGRLDFVISNAGIGEAKRFTKQPEEAFRDIFELNFFAAADLARAALPHLEESGGGRIVFSMSTAGILGAPGMAAYSSSKSALYGLTRALAFEGDGRGVKVNSIAPYAHTQMTDDYMPPNAKHGVEPERAALCATWLASPACTANGEVFIAGADRVRRARFLTSEAVIIPSDASDEATDAGMKEASHKDATHSAGTAQDDFLELLNTL